MLLSGQRRVRVTLYSAATAINSEVDFYILIDNRHKTFTEYGNEVGQATANRVNTRISQILLRCLMPTLSLFRPGHVWPRSRYPRVQLRRPAVPLRLAEHWQTSTQSSVQPVAASVFSSTFRCSSTTVCLISASATARRNNSAFSSSCNLLSTTSPTAQYAHRMVSIQLQNMTEGATITNNLFISSECYILKTCDFSTCHTISISRGKREFTDKLM